MPERDSAAVTLKLDRVARRFGRRPVFSDICAEVEQGGALVVTGPNGSGKSTLLRIIAGLLRPSAGSVEVSRYGSEMDSAARRLALGYVAPDLVLYPELTGAENLLFFGRLRGLALSRDDLVALLERVGLRGRGRDLVGGYSSGMRQRLKYAFALMHRPPVLVLDEPTANLDSAGAEIVREIVREQRKRGLVVIATNDPGELAWGDEVLRLGSAQAAAR